MRISLLGPVVVRADDGTLIDLGGARLRTLFIRLALDPGRTVSNDTLVDAVWEDEPPTNASNALQQLVSRLRRRGIPIQADPTGYRLDVPREAIDIFSDEADGPWRGPALADVADRPFAAPHITRLTELRAAAEEETASGVPELEALIIKYPLRERPVELLMRALWTQGRPAEALAVYEKYRRDIGEELGGDPSASLSRLHVEILQGQEPATQNLPLSLTSFIGRQTDVAQVKALLAKSRLVTLTGPGGSGKTRLAIESARSLGEARLVELAPLTEAGQIPTAILGSLGIREHLLLKQFGGQQAEPTDRVISALRSQHAVIILDNCEHLLDATAQLAAAVLMSCPEVKILATSREPLGIIGEALWTVEPLRENDAIQLLRERAEASRPGFAAEHETLAQLTQALDGMPLAIELAAARLRSMPIEQLYQRIDERFRLLTAGSRTALPRHQTLRAVVDWSWDLCTVDEREMWRCLAVFHGGANLEALQTVYGRHAWEVINALAEKSLARVDGDRYTMLETIREYALDMSDRTVYGERHAEYFTGLAERAEIHLRDDQQVKMLKVLRADHDNLDAAVRNRVNAGDVTMATRLLAAVGWYWWLGGYRAEGSRLAADVLQMPDAEPDALRARALAISAINILDGHGDIPQALEWYTESAEITKRVGAVHPMLKLAPPMALLVNWAVDGGAMMVSAYEDLFDDDDLWVVATARTFHAHGLVNMGRPGHEVRHEFEQALSGYRKIGDRWGMALALEALSVTAAQRGDFGTSAAQALEAIGLLSELGTSEDLLQLRMRLAQALWLDDKKAEALTTMEEAQRLADQLGAAYPQASMDVMWAIMARAQGEPAKAWEYLDRASATIAEAVVAPQFYAFLGHTRGLLAAEEGRLELARQEHTEAVEQALSSSDYPIIGIVLVGCADLVLREGDPDLAARLLGASEAMCGCVDHSIMDLPQVTAAVRAALPPDRFAAAYRLGQTATVENLPALVAGREA